MSSMDHYSYQHYSHDIKIANWNHQLGHLPNTKEEHDLNVLSPGINIIPQTPHLLFCSFIIFLYKIGFVL